MNKAFRCREDHPRPFKISAAPPEDGSASTRAALPDQTVNDRWTAVVLAGQRPAPNSLTGAFGGQYKALMQICGVSMLERVLFSLLDTPSIARIVVLGQHPDELLQHCRDSVTNHARITFAESSDGIAESIDKIVGSDVAPWPVLITTADHPLLHRRMIETFLAGVGENDLAIAAVERKTVLARYPENRRTWLKFRDGAYSGANLFALRGERTRRALRLWRQAERDRKQAVRLFWHFGPVLAVRAITRTIAFGDALRIAGANLGVSAVLVTLGFAEAAIDVDKLADYQLAEAIFNGTRASGYWEDRRQTS